MLKKCWMRTLGSIWEMYKKRYQREKKVEMDEVRKKWNLEDEDDIMCRNRFDIQIEVCKEQKL